MTIVFILIPFIISFIIILSRIKVNIQSINLKNNRVNDFQIIVSLALFGKIDIFRLVLNKKRANSVCKKIKKYIYNVLNSNVLTELNKGIMKDWKYLSKKIMVENLELNLKIGTEDAATTAYIVGFISIIISTTLERRIQNIKYTIEPLYSEKNNIFLFLRGIFTIKLVHIINIRKEFKEKEVYRKNGRTSNRRTYVHSNG